MSLNPIIKNTLDGMLSGGGSSLVAPPDWDDLPRRHCDPGPCPEDKWPRTPGPSPQPNPGPGGKWECKYVNDSKKPDWGGGVFDSPVLY